MGDALSSIATASPRLALTPAHVVSVHDADTLRVTLELEAVWPDLLGFEPNLRIVHVNAPELATEDGKRATESVRAWLSFHGPSWTVLVYGREKYGRLLADLRSAEGDLLSAYVLTLTGSKPMTLPELRDRLVS